MAMRRSHAFRARTLEGLEHRLTPATAGTASLTASALVTSLPTPNGRPVRLEGALQIPMAVTESVQTVVPFTGSGQVNLLGQVNASGSLSGTGRNGRGQLTLTNDSGTLQISLTHPVFNNSLRAPKFHLHFKVTGGTGAYANLTGQGTSVMKMPSLQVITSSPTNSVPLTLTLNGLVRGH
jgi:hypothetical protein